MLRHHHDLRGQRLHRRQEAPQLRRRPVRSRQYRGLRRERREDRRVGAQLEPRVQLPLQQLAEASRA
uniref:Uncharacterized protein n=1 Tax=Arundo donax TaxID=35708 RepID=A0A0A9C8T8_ARUDO